VINNFEDDLQSCYPSDFTVGRIGLIQEPGYKLRAVANPGRIFQRVLEPIGQVLYGTLPRLPWDCTFDQSKSFLPLQEALSAGVVVDSVDLSGATDYFPLELQEFILRKIFPKVEVDLFHEISRGNWDVPGKGQIQWIRGQPLGLYPSFGAFALTHGLLLLGLAGAWKGQFYVLGDDVVILDRNLAIKYLQILEELGCPVSSSKSLCSTKLCEFGGKVITDSSVIPQFKWRAISDDSFIDLARNLGPRSLPLFRSRQQNVLKQVSPVPECLGGLGWNAKGIPVKDRIPSWVFDEPKARELTTSFTPNNITLIYQSESYRKAVTRFEGRTLNLMVTGTLDLRAQALTKRILGQSFVPLYRLLGKNLDEVLRDTLECPDLPIQSVGIPASTLIRYENRLRKSENH
jgi:hypothetical protein